MNLNNSHNQMSAPNREAELSHLRRIIARQSMLIEDLEKRATEDSLTKILNRHGFDNSIEDAIRDFKRYGHGGMLLVIDMNDFKGINDSLGHLTGDAVLCHVANILKENTRESDIVARPGGDEFCVVLRETAGRDAKLKAAQLERKIATTPCVYEGKEILVTASIGTCAFSSGQSKDVMFSIADANMYRRKMELKTLKIKI